MHYAAIVAPKCALPVKKYVGKAGAAQFSAETMVLLADATPPRDWRLENRVVEKEGGKTGSSAARSMAVLRHSLLWS